LFYFHGDTLLGTITYPLKKSILKMIFLFPRWDMLISRVLFFEASLFFILNQNFPDFPTLRVQQISTGNPTTTFTTLNGLERYKMCQIEKEKSFGSKPPVVGFNILRNFQGVGWLASKSFESL